MKNKDIRKKADIMKNRLNQLNPQRDDDDGELKKILSHLEVSFGMEGYDLTEEDKEMVARIVSGQSSADEEVDKIIKKYAK